MKRKSVFCLICIMVFGFYSKGYCINGPFLDGQGARYSGMGFANIAATDDSTGIINNPGTLFVHDNGNMDVGFGVVYPMVNFKNDLNDEAGEDIIISAPYASFTTKPYKDNFKFGIGFFPIGGLGAEYRLVNSLYGDQVYKVDLLFAKLMPAVAYKVNDSLSVGISAGLGYQGLLFKSPYELHSGLLKGHVMAADIRADGTGFCYNLGAVYKITDGLKIGVVYKSETKLDLSGTATIDASALGAGTAKYDVDIDFTFPQTFGIGMAYQINDELLIAADFEWIDWSNAFNTLTFNFSKGSNPYLPTNLSDSLPLNWDDQYVFRIGTEYSATDKLSLRCGLNYGKSPVPDNTLIPLLVTIVETSGTIGIGYQYFENITLDLAYQYSFSNEQSAGVSLAGSEYNNSSGKLSAHTFIIGLSVDY